jgi:putative membrane protein
VIRNFSDHAANERTFLAWVRTSIAVMAFGFLVEKFGLFLQLAGMSLGSRASRLTSHRFGEIAGLALMILGLAMIVLAAIRFVRLARQIDDPVQGQAIGARSDLVLAGVLFVLGCVLFAYLASNLFGTS